MKSEHTPQSLAAFTERVRQAFADKLIHAPVHLCGGNEVQVIEAFKDVRPGDWVFSGWRSAYHALLKGIPEEWVYGEIVAGRSMYLMNREHRFFCSSIVGGILGIAAGVARSCKEVGGKTVHVFVGDMTARCGLFYEFLQYCEGFDLPVRVCIEDNGVSTDTPTAAAWGGHTECRSNKVRIDRYSYERAVPHVGIGQHVQF